ncbi:hypothetical protein BSKO_11058 [Bryopsis sp. KO-2023]|nr:hypothetical protein BSKO_11058 [Bryopsis sp. KO-2023]
MMLGQDTRPPDIVKVSVVGVSLVHEDDVSAHTGRSVDRSAIRTGFAAPTQTPSSSSAARSSTFLSGFDVVMLCDPRAGPRENETTERRIKLTTKAVAMVEKPRMVSGWSFRYVAHPSAVRRVERVLLSNIDQQQTVCFEGEATPTSKEEPANQSWRNFKPRSHQTGENS